MGVRQSALHVFGGEVLPQFGGCRCTTDVWNEFEETDKAVTYGIPAAALETCLQGSTIASQILKQMHISDLSSMEPEADEELKCTVFKFEGLEGAFAFLNIGMNRQNNGDLEGALNAFREALHIRTFMLNCDGEPSKLRGKELHSALFLCKEALEISECTGTQLTANGAILNGIYGILCQLRGDLDHAAEAYPQALLILEKLGEEHCHSRAVLLACLGDVRSELGNFKDAHTCYMEAYQVRLVKRMLQTHQGALLMISIGLTRFALDEPQSALEAYMLAKLVLEQLDCNVTNTFALLLNYIGMAKYSLGSFPGAITSLGQALSIHEKLNTLESPEGKHAVVCLHRAKLMLQQQQQQPQQPPQQEIESDIPVRSPPISPRKSEM